MKNLILILIFATIFVSINAQDLVPVTNFQGKYGYINSSGDTIIPCKYDKASVFSDGLALVKTNVKYKLVDKDGKLADISKFEFSNKFRFNFDIYGDALPQVVGIWQCNYIDEKGNVTLSIPYGNATAFSDGEATVYDIDKYNTINTKGVIQDKWKPINQTINSVYNGEKYALCDINGNLLSDFEYVYSIYFYNDLACVGKNINGDNITFKYGFVNNEGKLVIDYLYDEMSYFYGEVANVKKDGKYFLINNKNQKITEDYDYLTYVTDSIYIAQKDLKYALINIKGEILSSWYENLSNKYENLISFYKDGFYGLLDINGKVILQNKYSSVGEFYGNIASVGKDEDGDGFSDIYAAIDKSGKIITDFKYDEITSTYNNLIKVGIATENQDTYYTEYLYGFIDETGKEIIKCKYNYLADFYEGYAVAGMYDEYYYLYYGIIDDTGKEITEFIYSNIGYLSNGLFSAYKDSRYGYIDKNGKVFIDFQYEFAYDFSEGKALVGNYDYNTYVYDYFFIDKNNKRLTSNVFSSAGNYFEGISIAYNYADSYNYSDGYDYDYDYENYNYNYSYNILKYNGEPLVEDTFSYSTYFDDRDIIKVGKKTGENNAEIYTYLTKSGVELFPYLYQIAYFDQFPIIRKGDSYSPAFAVANSKGEPVSDFYKTIYTFKNGFAKVKNNNDKYGFINSAGKLIGEFYEEVDNFENGKAKVYKDLKVSFINTEGTILQPFAYDIINQTPNYKIIKCGKKYAITNLKDELLTDIYDTVEIFNDKIAILTQFGKPTIFKSTDNSLTSFSYIEDTKADSRKAVTSGKTGILDQNFDWIIQPLYDDISDFENGNAKVLLDGKTNSIDQTGKLLSSTWAWDQTAEFVTLGGLNFVKFENKYALVDKNKNKIGNWYYFVTEHNGNAVTKRGGFYYTLDEQGNETDYNGFSSNLTAVSNYTDTGYKYGYTDAQGNLVIDYKYDYAYYFNEGVAITENYGENYTYKYYVVNEAGDEINKTPYSYATTCSEGLICVQKDGYYGYIDIEGNTVIDFIYLYAYPFNDGLAKVQNSNYQYGFINREGKLIIDFSNNYINDFYGDYAIITQTIYPSYTYLYALINRKGEVVTEYYNNLTRVTDEVYIAEKLVNNQPKSAFINPIGKPISEWYDAIIPNSYGEEYQVISDNKIDFIDMQGIKVDQAKRQELLNSNFYFYEGLAAFSKTTSDSYYIYGFIDEQGNIVIDAQYDYVYNFSNNYAIVSDYGDSYVYSYALINKQGDVVTDWCQSIENYGTDMFKIQKDGLYSIFNNDIYQICDWTKTIINVDDNYFLTGDEQRFRLFDISGNEINDDVLFNETIKNAFVFDNDFATFSIYNPVDYTTKYGVVNTKGEIILQPDYGYLGNVRNGMILFSDYTTDYATKYGYINIKGETVIEPQFDYAYDFSENMAVVGIYDTETYETNYGYINLNGDLVVDYQFSSAESFSEGFAIVQKKFDYNVMMTYIDKNGKTFQSWYELVLPFKDKSAIALKYDKFVLVDQTGKETDNIEIIKQRLAEDYVFTDGLTKISKSVTNYGEPNTVLVNDQGKIISEWYVSIGEFSDEGLAAVELDLNYDYYNEFGYINKSGKLVIDIQYSYAEKFKNGNAIVAVPSSSFGYNYGIINAEGDYILDPVYQGLRNFSEGRAVVNTYTDDYVYKYGMIDEKGNLVIDYEFDYLGDMVSGMAVTYQYDPITYSYKYGYINKKGKLVVDYIYDLTNDFSDEMAVVAFDENADYTYEYGYINKKGKLIVPCEYENATPFTDGYGIVSKSVDGVYKSAFINKSNVIVSDWYDLLYGFSNGYALSYIGGKLVLLDKNFKVIENSDLLKEYLNKKLLFSEGLSPIQMNKKFGYVNQKGEIVIDFKFDYADSFYGGKAYVEIGANTYYLSPDGTLEQSYYNDYDYYYE